VTDPRYGGIITNAAVLSMTSGPLRTQPIARGSWIIEVVFNDPPPPPPNNVPPLKEDNNEFFPKRLDWKRELWFSEVHRWFEIGGNSVSLERASRSELGNHRSASSSIRLRRRRNSIMKQLSSILFAADLRSTGEDIVQAVSRLALAAGARVTLLHVLEPVAQLAPAASSVLSGISGAVDLYSRFGWHEVTENLRRVSQTALDDLASRLTSQGVDLVESAIDVGPAAETIVAKANDIDADLILIGAGDPARFERFSVGPVAVSVIERASQPVLAVRPGEPLLKFERILCPVDHSAPAARGLRNAIRLTKVFGGQLVVLSVIPEISWLSAAFATGQLNDALAAHASQWRAELEQFLAPIDFAGVSVTQDVRHGAPHRQIAAAAKEHRADLVVMGATGRTGLARVLVGSTTRRMLEELPCSLLTVKEEEVLDEVYGKLLRERNALISDARDLCAAEQYDRALPKLRRVLELTPFHRPTVESLAEVYEKLGDTALAEKFRLRAEQLRTHEE